MLAQCKKTVKVLCEAMRCFAAFFPLLAGLSSIHKLHGEPVKKIADRYQQPYDSPSYLDGRVQLRSELSEGSYDVEPRKAIN